LSSRRYQLGGIFGPLITLEIPYPPPCMYCGVLVPYEHRSMDGPLVCGPCDMGQRKDGQQKTTEEWQAGQEHAKAYIDRYRIDAKLAEGT
jgi:hypothetical protein